MGWKTCYKRLYLQAEQEQLRESETLTNKISLQKDPESLGLLILLINNSNEKSSMSD